jgi:hypothetical protein
MLESSPEFLRVRPAYFLKIGPDLTSSHLMHAEYVHPRFFLFGDIPNKVNGMQIKAHFVMTRGYSRTK